MDERISKKEAVRRLWHKGVIHWKLNGSQMDLYNVVKNTDKRIVTFLCSRRFGKSFSLVVLAVEACLKQPNSIIKFLCPTQKMVKTIIIPIMRTITEDCPKSLQPQHIVNDGVFRFKNGSEIQFAGNDNNRAENLRGGSASMCIVDEAGFCDDLQYTVRSVLLPTVTTTGGKIILSSTPPKSPGHEFVEFVRQAEYDGTLIKKTIYDNKMFTPAQVYEIIQTYGGDNHPEFKREFLCELSINLEDAVIPEFTEALEQEIVRDIKRPPRYDYYVAGDFGFKDYTAFLFAYLDFKNASIVIEDEILINKATTEEIAKRIKEKEDIHLTNPYTQEKSEPYLRVCDNNLFIINDLKKLHGINFLPTQKDKKEAAINQTRIAIASKKIIINPRCTNLIRHIKTATWKKSRDTFERTAENGHADLVDSLIYLVRNINWSKNPYPHDYGYNPQDVFHNKPKEDNSFGAALKKHYKFKKSL